VDLKNLIIDIPDFPIPGVMFRDISPVLKSPEALDYICNSFKHLVDKPEVDLVAGIEARGFILAMLLASRFNKGFLPFRKLGKLPPPTISLAYALEYAEASIEVKPGKERILIVDDVLATGGTLQAAIKLAETAGYEIDDVCVLINLTYLNSMQFKNKDVTSLVRY